jgi:hypothetical protein
MGWGGGTQVFDTVVEALRGAKVTEDQFKRVIVDLNEVLECLDWDNLCESDYYDDPQIKDIFDLWEYEDD